MPLAPPPSKHPMKRFGIIQHMIATTGATQQHINELCRLMRTAEVDLPLEALALEKLASDKRAWMGSSIPAPRIQRTMMESKPVICACPGWIEDAPDRPREGALEVVYRSPGGGFEMFSRRTKKETK